MQFAEGLSDRQAADAVRSRIDWKYALSLPLTDPGFDASVLSEFRSRLVAGGVEQQFLDTMLEGWRPPESTGAAADRLHPRPGSYPCPQSPGRGGRNHGPRLEHAGCGGPPVAKGAGASCLGGPVWPPLRRVPLAQGQKGAPEAEAIGSDGFQLLEAIYSAEAAWLREVPGVETLRQVWLQQYYVEEGKVRWRSSEEGLPPAARMINSPYDVEARYSTTWTGYKVHLTETCDGDMPHLITHVETTSATPPDFKVPSTIHTALAAKGLLPQEHLLDAGYVSSDLIASQQNHGIEVVGLVPPDNHWQARAGEGFDVACFALVVSHSSIDTRSWFR